MTSLCQQIILLSSRKVKQKDQVYAEAKLRCRTSLGRLPCQCGGSPPATLSGETSPMASRRPSLSTCLELTWIAVYRIFCERLSISTTSTTAIKEKVRSKTQRL